MDDRAARLVGSYVGQKMPRPGRESDLTPKELNALAKSKERVPLELREDGTFLHQSATGGVWTVEGDRVEFQPQTLGGETLESMRRRSEDAGREFRLGFLFNPFELRVDGDELVTADESSVVITVYRR